MLRATTEPAPAPAIAVDERAAMPAGFAAGSVAAGIKPSGRPDLTIVAVTTPEPASAAAAFTRNLVAAAPVRLSRDHLAATAGDGAAAAPPSTSSPAPADASSPAPGHVSPPVAGHASPAVPGHASPPVPAPDANLLPHGLARAVIVTAGSANAATGRAGDDDQAAIARHLAAALRCDAEQTIAASTGLIGTRLPVERVAAGIDALVPNGLAAVDDALLAAAAAMMTTDTRTKTATATLALPGPSGTRVPVRVSGIVKGVGMIHPGMATMIAVVLTDAAVEPSALAALLRPAIAESFDQLTVDGDTSTNDTVFALASGASGAVRITGPAGAAGISLGAALTAVCRSLARQQAADGEGATCRITCRVSGAADLADARAVSRAVAGSSLVKAAVNGRDPNWGRVAAAAGRAVRRDGTPVSLAVETLRVGLCGTTVFDGEPLAFDAPAVSAAMAAPDVLIEVDLGRGDATAEAWGCDLTEEYVRVNAEYST